MKDIGEFKMSVRVITLILLIAMSMIFFSAIGMGNPINYPQPTELTKPWWIDMVAGSLGQFPEINGWLMAIMGFLSIILRATAEILGFIAKKTADKKDDKIYKTINDASFYTGQVVGWFGGGKPRQIEKAKEVRKK